MKKTIKKLWTKALRSGEYKQAKNFLRVQDEFCCLGVLCDLHRKKVLKKASHQAWKQNAQGRYTYRDSEGTLPKDVMKWAGLDNKNPKVGIQSLSSLNDILNYDFVAIAAEIDERL